jgi:hypothetical protein
VPPEKIDLRVRDLNTFKLHFALLAADRVAYLAFLGVSVQGGIFYI